MIESARTPANGSGDSPRPRLVATMTQLIARAGVRGATFRDVGETCDVNIATIAHIFGSKEDLVAECFAAVVDDEVAYLSHLVDDMRSFSADSRLLAELLWLLIEDTAGNRCIQSMVLIELLLAAPGRTTYRSHAQRWLTARRDAFRALAKASGADPKCLDILGLVLLIEASFAVSCFTSPAYRLAARLTLQWLAARLLQGQASQEIEAAMLTLASTFYASEPDPDRRPVIPSGRSSQGRAILSRSKIIEAAAALIEEQGLSAVTNRAVAERSGVSLALTTYHFNTINSLAFAGAVRVFQKDCQGLEADASQSIGRRRAVPSRKALAAFVCEHALTPTTDRDRHINRGMVEISLAAARASTFDGLGLGMRRQRGVITYATMRRLSAPVPSRAAAAAYAMWVSALNLVSDAVGGATILYDVSALAELATSCITR